MRQSPVFRQFVFHRRQRDRQWEQLRLLLMCAVITMLWGWRLGLMPASPEGLTMQQHSQQWLAALSSFFSQPKNGNTELLFLWPPGHSPFTVALWTGGAFLFRGFDGAQSLIVCLNLLSLPGLYGIAKQLWGRSSAALLSVIVYGTHLGVLFSVRASSIQGLLLTLTLFNLQALLFCRLDLRGALLWGLALSGLLMTDSSVGGLLGVTGLGFLQWDTPRLLKTPWFWLGLGLGLLPAMAWGASVYLEPSVMGDVFLGESGSAWLRLVIGSLPSVVFVIPALKAAAQAWQWSWARLLTVFVVGYGSLATMLNSSLPLLLTNALLPLIPIMSVAAGKTLADCRNSQTQSHAPYPHWWHLFFGILSFVTVCLMGSIGWQYLWGYAGNFDWISALWILVFLVFTFAMTSSLILQQQADFIYILFWGLFVCLALLINTPLFSQLMMGLGF